MLEADILHSPAILARAVGDDVAKDDTCVVERAGLADVEGGLGADGNDGGRVIGAEVDVADAAGAVIVAEAGEDADPIAEDQRGLV